MRETFASHTYSEMPYACGCVQLAVETLVMGPGTEECASILAGSIPQTVHKGSPDRAPGTGGKLIEADGVVQVSARRLDAGAARRTEKGLRPAVHLPGGENWCGRLCAKGKAGHAKFNTLMTAERAYSDFQGLADWHRRAHGATGPMWGPSNANDRARLRLSQFDQAVLSVLPMLVNALLMSLATVLRPATAPNAISATTKAYSIRS